mgnify:CR=1 FL=1|jgi:hypothetical protein
MNEHKPGRDKAIIAYITVVGMLIAMSMNRDNKEEFATKHIKNMFSLTALWISSQVCFYFVHYAVGDAMWLISFVLCVYSIIGAFQNKEPNFPWTRKLEESLTFLD